MLANASQLAAISSSKEPEACALSLAISSVSRNRTPKRMEGMLRARLSTQMSEILLLMASLGLGVREAARQVGMHPDSAARALRKPHVKYVLNQMLNDVRTNAAHAAFLTISELAVKAESEEVRLRANIWIAGVGGIAAIKSVPGRFVRPIMIDFGDDRGG